MTNSRFMAEVQDDLGVDRELIRENMRLSLEERFERFRKGAESVLWLIHARESARPAPTSKRPR
jgi:hypothetical protein